MHGWLEQQFEAPELICNEGDGLHWITQYACQLTNGKKLASPSDQTKHHYVPGRSDGVLKRPSRPFVHCSSIILLHISIYIMVLHKYHVYVPCSKYSIDDLCTTLRFGVQQKDLVVNWPRKCHMSLKSLRVNLMEMPYTSSINLSRPVSWTSIQDNWLGEETMELLDSFKRLHQIACVYFSFQRFMCWWSLRLCHIWMSLQFMLLSYWYVTFNGRNACELRIYA